MNKNNFTFFFIFFISLNILSGQCTTDQLVEDDWVWTSGQLESQAWTAECDGDLEEVEFWPHEDWEGASTATFYLRAYNGCATLWTVPGIQVVPGEISNINLADGSGTSRTVVDGTKYMLAFIADTDEEATKLKISVNNPYSGGTYAITSENGNPWCDDFFPNWDLWFRASIDDVLGPLPVELNYFKANLHDTKDQIDLMWQTQSETNNLGFEVQRSTDHIDWETIDFVTGNGTTALVSEYQHTDYQAYPGNNYYRLKQIDYDGKFNFSDIEHVLFSSTDQQKLNVYPNPSKGPITISLLNPDQQTTIIKLFNSTGVLIWEQRFSKGEMTAHWSKEFNLPQHEVYFLTALIGKQIITQKISIIDNH